MILLDSRTADPDADLRAYAAAGWAAEDETEVVS